jgi:hypothetical protein
MVAIGSNGGGTDGLGESRDERVDGSRCSSSPISVTKKREIEGREENQGAGRRERTNNKKEQKKY